MCAIADRRQNHVLRLWIAEQQLETARRAIGLANQLSPGPSRIRHASRVFQNYNRLRSQVHELREQSL